MVGAERAEVARARARARGCSASSTIPRMSPDADQATPTAESPLPDPATVRRNALIVAVVGVVLGGVIPGLLGVVAVVRAPTRPDSARTLTTVAWVLIVVSWLMIGGPLALMFLT